MANVPAAIGVALRINGVTVGAIELWCRGIEHARRIRIFGAQSISAKRTCAPELEPKLTDELARKAARLVFAYPLGIEHQGQGFPRRAQAHVVACHLVSGLLARVIAFSGIVAPKEHVGERIPIARPIAAAELRR